MSETFDSSLLLSPVQLGPYRLGNRVVMAPMTRNRAGPGDAPYALNAEYYAQRAGAGLIVTEATQVSPQGKAYPGTPGIYSAAQVAGWQGVTEAVHQRGGRIFLQLWHVGRISHPLTQPDGAVPVAPSAIRPEGTIPTARGPQPMVTPRALATAEIPGIVAQFRHGAECAKEAGCDGVEIHAANGYLIDQFLRDGANRRDDAYGGSVENRARLLLEIVAAVGAVWGAERVGVRLSPLHVFNSMSDSDPAEVFGYVATALGRCGLAYLHVVENGPGTLDWRALKRRFGGTYIANGGYDFAKAEAAIAAGRADLVSFANLYLANPDLVERFRRGAALNAPVRATYYGGDHRGYTDYPILPTET
ncbi:MAG TPA: alkene reductase [Stellaceae bacterium]|nr:alkene reductase [Stellaceae bacterium]